MKILVVGSGGREHSLCWAVSASPLCDKLYCAPGNPGIANHATCIPIRSTDIDSLINFSIKNEINFVIIGSEAPLVMGLADELKKAGISAFGPSAAAAQLEGSKAFMKELLHKSDVPTAKYERFSNPNLAKDYINREGTPIVIKTDGLAAGKGVFICNTIEDAYEAIQTLMIEKVFGDAGKEIIIEEFLEGEEASFFVLVDGNNCLPMSSAQDHKTVGEGDTGPNTGGMGAYSPAPIMTKDITNQVMEEIIKPTVQKLQSMGTPYVGVLFAGLMITKDGPKILEYNIRFGDPECQVLMRRLQSDILPALIATAEGELGGFSIQWHDSKAIVVVMASSGYPGDYKKGYEINNIALAKNIKTVEVFHAGTKMNNKKLITDGGRVLNITAIANTLEEAKNRAYEAAQSVTWKGSFYRKDIGWRALKK